MIGMIEFATSDDGSLWRVVEEFAVEMVVGLAVGVAGWRGCCRCFAACRCPSRRCTRCASSRPPA